MGVFKWLRRERTPLGHRESGCSSIHSPANKVNRDTVRTDDYNHAYNQFLARRSLSIDPECQEQYKSIAVAAIPNRHHSGRQSLPASCIVCSDSTDKTSDCYNKANSPHRKSKCNSDRKLPRSSLPNYLSSKHHDEVPNIQFLFRNQVFMPGSVVEQQHRHTGSHFSYRDEPDNLDDFRCRQLDFEEDESADSAQPPPLFYKDNCLPFEVKDFLSPEEDVDIPVVHLELTEHESSDSQTSIEDKRSSDKVETPKKNVDTQLQDVLNELRSFDRWADDMLQPNSGGSREDETLDKKVLSDNRTNYLHMAQASSSEVSIRDEGDGCWTAGRWGVVPVHFKKLNTIESKEQSVQEVDLLMTCRHPNILLLMGVCYNRGVHTTLIFETFLDTLYNILHVQEHDPLTVQTSVGYASDIANALDFLHMQGYLHTNLSSQCVMLTDHDVAKLCNFELCCKFDKSQLKRSNIKHTINADNTHQSAEVSWSKVTVQRNFQIYRWSSQFRWHAPEQFNLDSQGTVHLTTRSDVYSLSLLLWECCNDSLPWKTLDYSQLGDLYLHWRVGVRLASDCYPACLLPALKQGLCVDPTQRSDMRDLCQALMQAKSILNSKEDMWILKNQSYEKESSDASADISHTKKSTSDFSEDQPTNVQSSEKSVHTDDEQNQDNISPLVRVPVKMAEIKKYVKDVDECDISENAGSLKITTESEPIDTTTYKTPQSKKQMRNSSTTPCINLHKSDSTEYCSLFSPDYYEKCNELNRDAACDSYGDNQTTYRRNVFAQTVTPKSYVPCQIKLPTFCNLDGIKTLSNNQEGKSDNVSTYTFDVRNYSLPTTPIARNTKLRRNAWLSGDFNGGGATTDNFSRKDRGREDSECDFPSTRDAKQHYNQHSPPVSQHVSQTRNAYSATKQTKPLYHAYSSLSSENTSNLNKLRSRSQSFSQPSEDALHKVNIRPLVAIHERWIMEANKKSCRSHSMPDNYRGTPNAVKPASHRLDLQQRSSKPGPLPAQQKAHNTHADFGYNQRAVPAHTPTNEMHSESYAQIREAIARKIVLPRPSRHDNYDQLWRKENVTSMANGVPRNSSTPIKHNSIMSIDTNKKPHVKIDKSTNTTNMEDWIKETIKTEIRKMLFDSRENLVNDGMEHYDEMIFRDLAAYIYAECKSSLATNVSKTNLDRKQSKSIKSDFDNTYSDVFSQLEPNTSELNKTSSLQITLKRNSQNAESRVKVSISDESDTRHTVIENLDLENERLNLILSKPDSKHSVLKRCQGFSAIQDARSTEDLYIDDEFSAHMDMGGICDINNDVKLVPVTGCLQGRACEPRDCCLAKLQQDVTCPRVFVLCHEHQCEQDYNQKQFSSSDMDNTQLQFSDFETQNESVLRRSVSVIEEVDEDGITSEDGNAECLNEKKTFEIKNVDSLNENEPNDADSSTQISFKDLVKSKKLGDGPLLYVLDDNFKMAAKPDVTLNEPNMTNIEDMDNSERINREFIYINRVNSEDKRSTDDDKEFNMSAISKITYFSFENIPENDSSDLTMLSLHSDSTDNYKSQTDS